jgi:small subunit ribosomal protein S9
MIKLNLNDLKKLQDSVEGSVTEQAKVEKKPNIDKFGRAYATGKRKNSVARVWIKRGKGLVSVNGKDLDQYFPRELLKKLSVEPLRVTEMLDQIDVLCTVQGGGNSGQAGSIRHGLAKALVEFNPDLRSVLKTHKLLTRDSRVVERKKPGQRKARKKTQFSKR